MQLLLARLISRTGLSWYVFTGLVCLTLVALAIGTSLFDGTLAELFGTDLWRNAFFYPALITYILVIVPPLQKSADAALEALRPLVTLDGDSFDHLLDDTFAVSPRGELIAFGAGAALGAWSLFPWIVTEGLSWMTVYWCLVAPVEIGLLGWSIYVAFAGTQPVSVVHLHLKDVDILDLGRFDPIGRQSLIGSLAFIGGAAIHLFFQFGGENVFDTSSLVVYGILAAISALIFFVSMRQTHAVLAAAKSKELQRVENNIVAAYRSLEEIPVGSPDISSLSAKLGLWQEYERRLKGVRTWPYNLGMLRTLALSVFTPVAISLVQRLIGQLLG